MKIIFLSKVIPLWISLYVLHDYVWTLIGRIWKHHFFKGNNISIKNFLWQNPFNPFNKPIKSNTVGWRTSTSNSAISPFIFFVYQENMYQYRGIEVIGNRGGIEPDLKHRSTLTMPLRHRFLNACPYACWVFV